MQSIIILFLIVLGLGSASDHPIIGVLTQERPGGQGSSIVGSYVKAVEQSGARVVPIFINRTEQYYRDILGAVNGVLFPGGGVTLNKPGGYGEAGRFILSYTKEVNSAGDHFPVLGVCLGMEVLFYWDVGSYDILDYCDSLDDALPLIFKHTFRNSSLYHSAPQSIINILEHSNITYNHHKRCVTEEGLTKHKLTQLWHVLSTSMDRKAKRFISSVESRRYPVAGIQFHPEKNAFEWTTSEQLPHSKEAISSARHFYDWLVNEARKSKHSFADTDAERAALIYNYKPYYYGQKGGAFELVYYFS